MRNKAAASIDDYLALQPVASRLKLERVRQAIRTALPEAVECISYSIPAFRMNNRIVLYFAGWAEHYSVYPASDAMVAAFDGALDAYRVSKGTLRFVLTDPVPATLIARVAKYRADEIAAKTAAKRRTPVLGSRMKKGSARG